MVRSDVVNLVLSFEVVLLLLLCNTCVCNCYWNAACMQLYVKNYEFRVRINFMSLINYYCIPMLRMLLRLVKHLSCSELCLVTFSIILLIIVNVSYTKQCLNVCLLADVCCHSDHIKVAMLLQNFNRHKFSQKFSLMILILVKHCLTMTHINHDVPKHYLVSYAY